MPQEFLTTFHEIFNRDKKILKIVIPRIQRDYAQGRENGDIKRKREMFLSALLEPIKNYKEYKKNKENYVTPEYKPVTLDFIYGDIKEDEKAEIQVMTPLDGQQRLTTLFLLYWYAAKINESESHEDSAERSFLEYFTYGDPRQLRFTYDTRPSTRDFLDCLVEYKLDLNKLQGSASAGKDNIESSDRPIETLLKNEYWFLLDWNHDPTIRSMLVMLDCIHRFFHGYRDILWDALTDKENPPINFFFLPISGMGLKEEHYIKMNYRGLPLTAFEHFKAALIKELNEVKANYEVAQNKTGPEKDLDIDDIINKLDGKWSDLFWPYVADSSKKVIDDKFLRLFRFVCRIIQAKNEKNLEDDDEVDELDLIHCLFNPKNKDVIDNIRFFNESFDAWSYVQENWPLNKEEEKPQKRGIDHFFSDFVAKGEYEKGKITIEKSSNEKTENSLFKKCIFSDKLSKNDCVLLYAFQLFAIKAKDKDACNHVEKFGEIVEKFRERIRVICNLVKNSEDELKRNLMKILEQVESLIECGELLSDSVGASFNKHQITEERNKQLWIKDWKKNKQEDKISMLHRLEDHRLLYGQISIVGKNTEYYEPFEKIFCKGCDYKKIDRALMVYDYIQCNDPSRKQDFQCGSSNSNEEYAWRNIFHNRGQQDYSKTQEALQELLKNFTKDPNCEPNGKLDHIIRVYLDDCINKKHYEWRYYYIKYPDFTGHYGKYHWEDYNNTYEMLAITTKLKYIIPSAYQPFLKAVVTEYNKEITEDSHKLKYDYIDRQTGYKKFLEIGNYNIECKNAFYLLTKIEAGKKEQKVIKIKQNMNIDAEDRILMLVDKLKEYKKPDSDNWSWMDKVWKEIAEEM